MRNERGSITLYVLVTMIFFTAITLTSYMSASLKIQGQNDEIESIKASYSKDVNNDALLQLYNRITKTRDWLPGSGTLDDTYKIYTIEDLIEFSLRSNSDNFSGKYVELMNDLDFNINSSYLKSDRTDFGDINNDGNSEVLKTELTTGTGFPCIATNSNYPFLGTFLGNNHEIKNLRIYQTGSNNNSGLFGIAGNSTIQDLNIKGTINDSSANAIGGIVALVASNTTCNINNCSNEITINGSNNIGGLVGLCQGEVKINSSYNKGTISGQTNVGGIIGIENNSQSIINNCYNTGAINGINAIGGIVGNSLDGSINNCYNIGNVTGTTNSYSVVGTVGTNSTINNCYYLSGQSTDNNATPKLEIEMKTQTFVDLLNTAQTGLPWNADTNNANSGYPILSWQI